MSAAAQTRAQPQAWTSWLRREIWQRERWGWAVWAVFALIVAVNRFSEPPLPASVFEMGRESWHASVFQMYRDAAERWLEGRPLFNGTGGGAIYLPQAYLLFVPFTVLPFQWGGALWRVVNIGLFAVGVWRFARLAGRDSSSPLFSLVSLPVVLLSWSAARYGQMTMAMGGVMLLAVVALADRRWWWATLWLILGVALKPLAIVLALLAAVLHPRTSWRLVVGVGVLFAVPFLTQRPGWVLEQYGLCLRELRVAVDVGEQFEFAHFFWLLRTCGVVLAPLTETVVRMLAAVVTLGLGAWAGQRCSRAEAGVLLFTLATCYLMLFNPRTENNTYCLLAPAVAIFLARAVIENRSLQIGFYVGWIVIFLARYPLGKLLTGGPNVWLRPLLCLIFLAVALYTEWRDLQQTPEPAGQTAHLGTVAE
jgi:alpha-1,2-mannosyltransferase